MTTETKTQEPPPPPDVRGTSFQGGFERATLPVGAQAWFSLIGAMCLGVGIFTIGGWGWLMMYCGFVCFGIVVGSKMK